MGRRINHLALFSLIFVAGLNSCNFPLLKAASTDSFLTEVTSEVFQGGNVHIKVDYVRGKEKEVTLLCDYPDGKGGTTQYQYKDIDRNDIDGVTSFDFTILKNGKYTATCNLVNSQKAQPSLLITRRYLSHLKQVWTLPIKPWRSLDPAPGRRIMPIRWAHASAPRLRAHFYQANHHAMIGAD